MTVSAGMAKFASAGTGAPPASKQTWDQVNWDQVTEEVTRLQTRIAKATHGPVRLRAVGRLEPCAGKLACTVLGGEHAGNGVFLPDEKAVAHPTDSRLLEASRRALVKVARGLGIQLKQTYAKEDKRKTPSMRCCARQTTTYAGCCGRWPA